MANISRWQDYAQKHESFHLASYVVRASNPVAMHTHDFAEVYWITQGSGVEQFPGGALDLQQGSVCFAHQEVTHSFESQHGMTLVNLAFPTSVLDWLHQLTRPRLRPPFNRRGDRCRHFRLPPAALEALESESAELFHAPRAPLPLLKFLTAVFSLIERGEQRRLPSGTPDWLRDAARRIREPAQARAGLDAFYRLAGRSPEHVCRITRHWLKKSPRDLVRDARLDLVAEALTLSDHSVLEIAADAGFENTGYFYKVFNQRFGLPPQQYRHQQRRIPGVG